jgi:hypothetical protein
MTAERGAADFEPHPDAPWVCARCGYPPDAPEHDACEREHKTTLTLPCAMSGDPVDQSTIVERLRAMSRPWRDAGVSLPDMPGFEAIRMSDAAADEIERLREVLAELLAWVEALPAKHPQQAAARRRAREALAT